MLDPEELNNDRPSWKNRKSAVAKIKEYLSENPGDLIATKRLQNYAADEKWEIRAEVANSMSFLSENDLPAFQKLLGDNNAYVASSAKFALEKRQKMQKSQTKQQKVTYKIFKNLERIKKDYGMEAYELAREDIANAYEMTVGYAAHDIRGMLSPINSRLELMSRIASNELPSDSLRKFNEAKSFINTRLTMILRMVEDIQLLSRKTTEERRKENVRNIILEAVEDVKNIFTGKLRDISSIEFDLTDVAVDLVVPVFHVSINLAVVNLLKNAIESYMMSSDSINKGVIKIYAQEVIGGVEISVRDYGIGIEEKDLRHLRAFLPKSTSKKKTGTGLGMAIAYSKVKDHGGSIKIESEGLNKGTITTIYLPYAGSNR